MVSTNLLQQYLVAYKLKGQQGTLCRFLLWLPAGPLFLRQSSVTKLCCQPLAWCILFFAAEAVLHHQRQTVNHRVDSRLYMLQILPISVLSLTTRPCMRVWWSLTAAYPNHITSCDYCQVSSKQRLGGKMQ